MKKIRDGYGWAWAVWDEHRREWGLCYWAAVAQDSLDKTKPSPEAKKVYVRISAVRQPRGVKK